MMRRLLSLLALTTAACGGDAAGPTDPLQATFAPALGVDLSLSTRTVSGAYVRDLVVGTGATAANGNRLSVRYAGFLVNGSQFDANPAPAPLFGFTLGAGQVIQGWDEGLLGMRVGGRRQLVIPPALGYGARAVGSIPPNSILVFTVELVSIP